MPVPPSASASSMHRTAPSGGCLHCSVTGIVGLQLLASTPKPVLLGFWQHALSHLLLLPHPVPAQT
eukprot:246982-Amphidinium_carterae.1